MRQVWDYDDRDDHEFLGRAAWIGRGDSALPKKISSTKLVGDAKYGSSYVGGDLRMFFVYKPKNAKRALKDSKVALTKQEELFQRLLVVEAKEQAEVEAVAQKNQEWFQIGVSFSVAQLHESHGGCSSACAYCARYGTNCRCLQKTSVNFGLRTNN